MGYSYVYKCEHCGYSEHFNHGHGYLVHPQSVNEYLRQKKKLFHYKTHDKIIRLSKLHSNLQIKASFQIYRCIKCNLLYDKAEIRIYDNKNLYHRNSFRCKKCNSRLKRTNIHRLKNATCPVCKKRAYKMDIAYHDLWK